MIQDFVAQVKNVEEQLVTLKLDFHCKMESIKHKVSDNEEEFINEIERGIQIKLDFIMYKLSTLHVKPYLDSEKINKIQSDEPETDESSSKPLE